MSKQLPVELRYPHCYQLRYLAICSLGSKPSFSRRLSARQSAIEVSSVHCPGFRRNGPPPDMPATAVKLPREENSTIVPTASPQARPTRAPTNLSSDEIMHDLYAEPNGRVSDSRTCSPRLFCGSYIFLISLYILSYSFISTFLPFLNGVIIYPFLLLFLLYFTSFGSSSIM